MKIGHKSNRNLSCLGITWFRLSGTEFYWRNWGRGWHV